MPSVLDRRLIMAQAIVAWDLLCPRGCCGVCAPQAAFALANRPLVGSVCRTEPRTPLVVVLQRRRGMNERRRRADTWKKAQSARSDGHSARNRCMNRTCTAQTRYRQGTYGAHTQAQTAVSRSSNGPCVVSATLMEKMSCEVTRPESLKNRDLGTTSAPTLLLEAQIANSKRVTADRQTGLLIGDQLLDGESRWRRLRKR